MERLDETKVRLHGILETVKREMFRQDVSYSDMAYRLKLSGRTSFSRKLANETFTAYELLKMCEILKIEI